MWIYTADYDEIVLYLSLYINSNSATKSLLYVQIDLNARYWVHGVGLAHNGIHNGWNNWLKETGLSKYPRVARLISERMWTFIVKQGQQPEVETSSKSRLPPGLSHQPSNAGGLLGSATHQLFGFYVKMKWFKLADGRLKCNAWIYLTGNEIFLARLFYSPLCMKLFEKD